MIGRRAHDFSREWGCSMNLGLSTKPVFGRSVALLILFAMLFTTGSATLALTSPEIDDSEEKPVLADELVRRLDHVLSLEDPRDDANALWLSVIVQYGSPELLLETVEGRLREKIEAALFESDEEDPDLATADILPLRRLLSRLLRILGDLDRAHDQVSKIPIEVESTADVLEKAQILDALGKNEEAHEAFGRVLDREIEVELRSAVLLRRALLLDPKKAAKSSASLPMSGSIPATLISSGAAIPLTKPIARAPSRRSASSSTGTSAAKPAEEREKTPLAKFAADEETDSTLANRAAMILALRGEQEDAVSVFTVKDGKQSHRFRQEVRLAEWSLEAEEWQRAQEFAWAAVESAKLKRDRRYALTLLVESYRREDALGTLIERFAASDSLTPEARQVWIDLLRETERVEEALELFRSTTGTEFTIDMRRELLELCRETGQEVILVEAYRDLIQSEPRFIEWREGLSRYHLERGDRDAALRVWRSYLEATDELRYRMAAATTLMAIGLDELAEEFARACQEMGPEAQNGALLFLFELHLARSRMDDAREALEELVTVAEGTDPVHKDISDAYARLGEKGRAVEVLQQYREAKGENSNPDTDMKLALLLSDIGQEDKALELWEQIWRQVDSIPRRRYVEERLMAVASRLGKLASIAVSIEKKLDQEVADDRDVGLLVRLYTHVKDPVSATEIVETFWKKTGRKAVEVLAEKARIFIACQDFWNYEKVIEELINTDPEGRPDYLRQLAMSKLEGGKRDEAREILERLKAEESDSVSLEFEAGVLALAGLREEALAAYRKTLANNPERIDTYLLLSNIQKDLGRHTRSAGMFQYLAENAARDDLFTIAIDGILNMRDGRRNTGAPDRLVEWARRIVLERIARRPGKLYLYRLVADLSEELNDTEFTIRALKTALPIAGEQRTPILRELMTLSKPGGANRGVALIIRDSNPVRDEDVDNTEQLMFGRRLLGQGELVPPQVYLELGEAFLRSREVVNATKTFQRMSQLPEFGELQPQIAEAFEKSRYPKEALRVYERILTVEPTDVGLLSKVGELQEQLGRDDVALELYRRGLDLVLSRRAPRKIVNKDDDAPKPRFSFFGNRNVDEAEQYYSKLVAGIVAVQPESSVSEYLDVQLFAIDEELSTLVSDAPTEDLTLAEFPRLAGKIRCYRRLAFAFRQQERIEELDRRILLAFPDDKTLLESMVRSRIAGGYVVAARRLVDESDRPEKEKKKLALLVGGAREDEIPGVVPLAEATALILPLLASGDSDQVREILQRLDLSTGEESDQAKMPILHSTALFLKDAELVLGLSRHWLNLMIQHSPNTLYSGVENILQRSGKILDESQRQSLIEQIIDAINENPDKFSGFISRLPNLRETLGGEIFTVEQVEKLIEKRLDANDQFIYGIPELFALLPSSERGLMARRIWSKLPKAQAGLFAVMLLPVLDEKIDSGFADFLVEAFRRGVDQADDPEMFSFYIDDVVDTKSENADVYLRFVRVLAEKEPDSPIYKSAEAFLLLDLDRHAEAWELASGVFRERVQSLEGELDWRAQNALQRIFDRFYEDYADRFEQITAEAEADSGKQVELTKLKIDLIRRRKDSALLLAAIEDAIRDFPEEVSFLRQLQSYHSSRGERFAALEVQKKMVELEPEDEKLQNRLVTLWRGLKNPVEVLALLEEKETQEKDQKAAAKKKRTPPPSIVQVKEALEAKDQKRALTIYRRLWRNFTVGRRDPMAGMVFYVSPSGTLVRSRPGSGRRQLWPQDPSEDADADTPKKKRSRGGIPDLSPREKKKEETASEEVQTAQDVLIELAGGDAEILRQLRSLPSGLLGSDLALDIFRAMARQEADRVGAAEALDRLLDRERQGEVGKLEYGLIFSLLEMAQDRGSEELTSTLSGMLENLSPTDTTQLRRLARLYAKNGLQEKAGRIYRWCVVVRPAGGSIFWQAADDLLDEVIEELEGEERIRTVEAVLSLSDPGEDSWWGREEYEVLVLETWEKLLGADRALEKARETCEDTLKLELRPKRRSSQKAAYLFARGGEWESALAALEIALCKFEAPSDLEYPWFRQYYENPGRAGFALYRQLFPEDSSEWNDPENWYRTLGDQLDQWSREDRLLERTAFEMLALCSLRLHQLGDPETSQKILALLDPFVKESASRALWVADLERTFGNETRALEIEQSLLEEGRMHLGRLPLVIARLRESSGAKVALEMGEIPAAYTLDPELVDELIESAEAAELSDRAEHWRQRKSEAEAAAEKVKRRDQADKASSR